jgi:PAS domain-containing protein
LLSLLSVLLYSLFSQRQRALAWSSSALPSCGQRAVVARHPQPAAQCAGCRDPGGDHRHQPRVISTFNAGAERMLGYPASEAIGQLRLEDLVLPEELNLRAHA